MGNNEDVTVALTRTPPTLTLVNNVGAAITVIQMRVTGDPRAGLAWAHGGASLVGGAIHVGDLPAGMVLDVGGLTIAGGAANAVPIWRGNIRLAGDTFDILVTDVGGNQFQVNNVQLTSNQTVTITQAHRN